MALTVIFWQFHKFCPELNSLISIFYKFSKNVLNIFDEYIPRVNKSSNVCYFFLKSTPNFRFILLEMIQFLFISESRNSKQSLNKIILIFVTFSSRFHRYPPMPISLLLGTNSKGSKIFSEVDIGMFGNNLSVLNNGTTTKFLSSQVSKKTLCSTPFGSVFMI